MEIHEKIPVLQLQAGFYAEFGGKGIINGLKIPPAKVNCYKIIAVNTENIILREYRKQKNCRMPSSFWNQSCRIHTPSEYKHLPKLPGSNCKNAYEAICYLTNN